MIIGKGDRPREPWEKENPRLASFSKTHYIGYMIATLRESKTKLSELVALAEKGEEVLITVHGKPRARLIRVTPSPAGLMAGWQKELASLQDKYSTRRRRTASQEIMEDLRKERFEA